jgi:hypothetical protein
MSKITDKEIEELRKRAENRSLDFGMGGVETFVPNGCIVVSRDKILALIERGDKNKATSKIGGR